MPEPTVNVLLAGVGGQGVVLAGRIICAALQAAGYAVKQAEVHGMAQRGGSVVAQIRFGQEVRSPLFGRGEAQVMLAFERLEGLRHLAMLAPGGTVILNDQAVLPMPVVTGLQRYPEDALARLKERAGELLVVQALETAAGLGDLRVANTVLVGALAGWLARPGASLEAAGRLTREKWLQAVEAQVPAPGRDLNRQAFLAGYAEGCRG